MSQTTVPLTANIQIDTLNINSADFNEIKEKYDIDLANGNSFITLFFRDKERYEKLINELSETEVLNSEQYVLDFSKVLSPFYDRFLYADAVALHKKFKRIVK